MPVLERTAAPPTLEEAQRQFQDNWSKYLVWAKLEDGVRDKQSPA